MLGQASFVAFIFSPLIVGAAGFWIATKMPRLRWMVHLLAIAGMVVVGPFILMLEREDGSVGLLLVLFFLVPVLTFALPGYLMMAFLLWHSRKHPTPKAS